MFCCQYFKEMSGNLDEVKMLENNISGSSRFFIVVRQRRQRSINLESSISTTLQWPSAADVPFPSRSEKAQNKAPQNFGQQPQRLLMTSKECLPMRLAGRQKTDSSQLEIWVNTLHWHQGCLATAPFE